MFDVLIRDGWVLDAYLCADCWRALGDPELLWMRRMAYCHSRN
jgi:hypothetical protein